MSEQTDTIEAVARALSKVRHGDEDEWELCVYEAQTAIAAHTKALVDGAGELGRLSRSGIWMASDPEGEYVRYDQAAATIAALRAEIERHEAALRVIRRNVETGIWCQSDIEWFVGEVFAGRQPDYLRTHIEAKSDEAHT